VFYSLRSPDGGRNVNLEMVLDRGHRTVAQAMIKAYVLTMAPL